MFFVQNYWLASSVQWGCPLLFAYKRRHVDHHMRTVLLSQTSTECGGRLKSQFSADLTLFVRVRLSMFALRPFLFYLFILQSGSESTSGRLMRVSMARRWAANFASLIFRLMMFWFWPCVNLHKKGCTPWKFVNGERMFDETGAREIEGWTTLLMKNMQ